MKKFILLAIPFWSIISCTSSQQKEEAKSNVKVVEGFSLPEGACTDGKYIYISNVGKEFKPLDKDGDGFISRLSKDGKIETLNFLPQADTMHSPKGMAVANNILYVTDIDKVKGYDLNTRKKVFDADFSSTGTVLLNDISLKNDSSIFVSAMDIDKVYEVSLKSGKYTEVISLKKPNGLFWDPQAEKLYIGLFGRENNANGSKGDIGCITFKDGKAEYQELSPYQGNIDGVAVKGDVLFYTDWLSHKERGTLKALDLKTGTTKDLSDTIDGPGDFYYDMEAQQFYVPKMRENKLLIISEK